MLIQFFEGRAFTGTKDKPLGKVAIGNPALICYTEELLPDDVMRRIALLSASPMTTFLAPNEKGYEIRYFSPNGSEVDLCGHATIASTFFIKQFVSGEPCFQFVINSSFHSSTYNLTGFSIASNLAISTRAYTSKVIQPTMIIDDMSKALGIDDGAVHYIYKTELNDYVFVLRSNKVLRKITPDFDAVINIGKTLLPHRTLVLSALSDEGNFDYEARVFAPLLGINEDIACGSVNCSLAPIWCALLKQRQVKMFYCSPDKEGSPITGGVQMLEFTGEKIIIESNVLPTWSRILVSQDGRSLLKDEVFIRLMKQVKKASGIKVSVNEAYTMKKVG